MSNKGTSHFVHFPSKQESEAELLLPDSTFGKALAGLPAEAQSQILEGLDKILHSASDLKVNTPPGEPKIKVGNWHIRLRFSFWESVKTAGTLVITLLKLKAGGNVKDVAETAIDMISGIVERISHLKPEELMVYEGVVDVIHSKWDKTLLVIPGASAPELDELFRKRRVLLALNKIRTLLGNMSTDKRQVLKVEEEIGNETYYVPVF